VAQSALSLSRLGFAAFRVSWRLVDDDAAAPPSPAMKARGWRFVDAAGARMMVAGAVARCCSGGLCAEMVDSKLAQVLAVVAAPLLLLRSGVRCCCVWTMFAAGVRDALQVQWWCGSCCHGCARGRRTRGGRESEVGFEAGAGAVERDRDRWCSGDGTVAS